MTSCTTNEPCRQGYCCESRNSSYRYHTCTYYPSDCYTGDGTRDEYQSCSSNSECATDCCHKNWNYCWGTTITSNCKSDSLPGWAIAIIVVVCLVVVGLIILCVCCCICAARRRRQGPSAPLTNVTVISANHSSTPMTSNQPNLSAYPSQSYSSTPHPGFTQGYPSQPGYVAQAQPGQYIPQPGAHYQHQAPPQVAMQPSFQPQQPVAVPGRAVVQPQSG